MDAYLTGLEQAHAKGVDLSTIRSVASFFVSRVDTEVDKRLDAIGTARRGQGAAQQGRDRQRPARLPRRTRRSSPPTAGQPLEAAGAHKQRPLWASTSVKDPEPSRHDVRHRAGRARHRQHDARGDDRGDGRPRRDHRRHRHDELRRRPTQVMAGLEKLGISYDDVVQVVEDEGVDKFEKSWQELLDTVTTALGDKASRVRPPLVVTHLGGVRRRRSRRWSPTRWRAGSPPRTPRSGARTPSPRPRSGCRWVDLPAHVAAAARRDRRAARRAVVRGPRPGRAVRHGRLVAGARGDLAHATTCRSTILDSTNPSVIRRAVGGDLSRTVVVVSSKSGGTLETDSQRRAFVAGVRGGGHRRRLADRRRHRPGLRPREAGHASRATARSSSPTRTSAAATAP